VKGKLAQDADIEDVIEMLDQLEDVAEEMEDAPLEVAAADPEEAEPVKDDGDLISQVKALCEGASPEEIEAVIAALKPTDSDVPPAVAGDDEPKVTKAAMDAALRAFADKAARDTAQARKDAETATIARLRDIAAAEKATRPFIGELSVAMDSAEDYYRMALDNAGVNVEGVPPAAFAAMVGMLSRPAPEVTPKQATARVAMDAAAVTARHERFPNANRLKIQ
jgi:hypothetical protein